MSAHPWRLWTAVCLLLVTIGGLFFLSRSREGTEFRSVEDLVGRIEERGPDCGGPLEVRTGKVAGDGAQYETGDCDRFDDYDVANFYWFPDHGHGVTTSRTRKSLWKGGISTV